MAELTPIRRELLVDAEPGTAFAVFTEGIGSWWPLAKLSVYGAGSSVAFRDAMIVEVKPGRPDTVWGTVTRWEPPTVLAFTWHPGADAERASRVSVTFTPHGQQTLVRLDHAGWENFTDPGAARAEYEHGWPMVLASFEHSVEESLRSANVDADVWTWVALMHRPGRAARGVQNLFQDPRFGDHVAFLQRMREAGFLVAAGPLGDEPGSGMTILRLNGPDRLAVAIHLATSDDISVASGFFDVTVRPWDVVMHT